MCAQRVNAVAAGRLWAGRLINDDTQYQVLRLLEADPEMSQRQIARALGLSVGKTHYALKALLDRGWVKTQNFRRSDNRSAYLYKLTPGGLQEKARLAYHLLKRKRAEHEALMTEIEQLRTDIQNNGQSPL